MIAYAFPSRTVEGLNFVLLEDGSFGGSFLKQVPERVTEGHEVIFITVEEAPVHEGLGEALRLNKLLHGPQPKIFIFGTGGENECCVYAALAESGYTLAIEQAKTVKRAKWKLGLHSRCDHHHKYEAHYPDGFEIVLVDDPEKDPELTLARAKNQMLSDIRGSKN